MQTNEIESMIFNYLKRKKITQVMSLGSGDYHYFKDENGNEYYVCCGLVDVPTNELKQEKFRRVNSR